MELNEQQVDVIIGAALLISSHVGYPGPNPNDIAELRRDKQMLEALVRFSRMVASNPAIASIEL